MTHETDPYHDPAWREFERAAQDDLLPKLRASAATLSLVPEGPTDMKFAVELGLSIMLDKPIVAVVEPGTKVPDKLVRVADQLIEADFRTAEGQARLSTQLGRAMEDLLRRLGGECS